MKRKLLSAISAVAVLLMAGGTAFALVVPESSGYESVIYDESIQFSAVLQADGSVKSNWSKYAHAESFTYYKLVRSQKNANPVYPDDGYIYYGGDIDGLSYSDADVPDGLNYYRICQIASPKRYCSKTVVAITKGAGVTESVTPSPVKTTETESVPMPVLEPVAMVPGFKDVPADYWVADCVKNLAADGILVSGDDVYFRPESPINRAEFLKLVMKSYYADGAEYDGSSCFRDVGDGAWYALFICSAKDAGIVSGYSDNSYGPVRNITRAEGAAILVKALHVPVMAWEAISFTDVTADWQKTVVAMAYKKGLVNGYNAKEFGPNDLLTRAQSAKLICNARNNFAAPLEGAVPVIGAGSGDAGPIGVGGVDEGAGTGTDEAVTLLVEGTSSRTTPLIVNHANTALSSVSSEFIATAKSSFKIAYGHTSHGSQIVTGMGVLEGQDSNYSYSADGSGGSLYLNESLLSGDLGSDWETQTRALLNRPGNDINMVMWAWCGQLSSMSDAEVNGYLQKMDKLEQDFPSVIFVYFTGHLDGSGKSGTLNINNEKIRAFAIAYNKVLFDFADIESYDPAGSYYLDQAANDNNDYTGGNWSQNWCAANSGSALCATNSCAHSQSLNCNLKARAFWWMMARLAGWGG